MVTLLAWQPAQFAAKIGATSLAKDGASSAHTGIAKQSRIPTAMGTTPLIPASSKLLPFSLHPSRPDVPDRRRSRLKIAKHRGHFGQTDCLKSLRHRIAFTAGIHEELAIRLQILDGEIKALLGLRRPASFDVESPAAVSRNLQNEIDLRARCGAIEAGHCTDGRGSNEVLDREAFPTGACNRMA